MENYGLTDGTIEILTEKAEKIMSYYDSYKLDAREWKNYGKHRVYVLSLIHILTLPKASWRRGRTSPQMS